MRAEDPPAGPSPLIARILQEGRRGCPALQIGAHALSYAGLAQLVRETAAGLRARGVGPGDRVLLLLPNGPEHVVAVLAVLSAGAIAIPLAAQSGSRRLASVVDDAAPRLCLVEAGSELLAGPEWASLELDLAGASARLRPEPARPAPPGAWPAAVRGGDVAFVRYTSGSTGEPKGVVLGHSAQLWTARTLSEVFAIGPDHRELVLASLAHSGAWQRVAATLYGGGCVLLASGPLSVPGLLEDVEQLGATGFFTPPPLIRLLLANPAERVRRALAACRCLEIGSAPVRAEEIEGLLALAPSARVFIHYGLTEFSRATILDARAHPDKLHSVGRAAPGVELALRPAPGGPEGPEEQASGEILLRGPQQARGYWRRTTPSEPEGWLSTGDHGRLDEQGFLTFLGRRDDRINSGGFSFFPAEVERELGVVEGVTEYLVAGVPDPRDVLGQVPWAFVVAAQPEREAARALLGLARRRLPAYMVPRRVVEVPSLPLTESGKPDRRAAVERYARGERI